MSKYRFKHDREKALQEVLSSPETTMSTAVEEVLKGCLEREEKLIGDTKRRADDSSKAGKMGYARKQYSATSNAKAVTELLRQALAAKEDSTRRGLIKEAVEYRNKVNVPLAPKEATETTRSGITAKHSRNITGPDPVVLERIAVALERLAGIGPTEPTNKPSTEPLEDMVDPDDYTDEQWHLMTSTGQITRREDGTYVRHGVA